MTNDEIINQIIQQMPLASVSINICDAATRAAKASLSYKDNQPISELGGWHTEPPKAITLSEAIDFCKNEDTKDTKTQLRNEQFVTWFTKLASYEDKTYIEADWLVKNGFEKREYDYLYCDDVEEISAQCIDAEMGVWRVSIGFLDHCENTESLNICTVGQFRMFLAICGLDNLVNEFKS